MLTFSPGLPAPGAMPQRLRQAGLRAHRPLGARLLGCRAGNVAVEFALAAPVLLLLMLGSAEMARFVILHQKMDRVATTISDLVSRAETISETQLDDIFEAIGEVATPFDIANLGVVIVSSITNPTETAQSSPGSAAAAGRTARRANSAPKTRPSCRPASRCARARPRSSPRCTRFHTLPQRVDRGAAGHLSKRSSPAAARDIGNGRPGLSVLIPSLVYPRNRAWPPIVLQI